MSPASLLWIGGMAMLVGVLLAFRGYRPSRRGGEPRCRRCEYDLRGLPSPRCPECGSEITPKSVVHGARYRRPWLILVGLLTTAIACAPLYTAARRIVWYQHYPMSWIVSDLQDPKRWSRTADEMVRRMQSGQADSAANALIRALDRNPPFLVGYSLLGCTRTPAARSYLERAIRSPDPRVRQYVACGLSNSRERWAIPLLIGLLDDPALWMAPTSNLASSPARNHYGRQALYDCLFILGLRPGPREGAVNAFDVEGVKRWWAQYGEDFLEGKDVPKLRLYPEEDLTEGPQMPASRDTDRITEEVQVQTEMRERGSGADRPMTPPSGTQPRGG